MSGAQIKGQPNKPIAFSSIFGWIICGCYKNSKSVYSNICYLLRVNTETVQPNHEINSAKACDSFDNNFNNKLSRAEVIEKDRVVIDEKLNTKDEHLSIIEHFSENIGYHENRYCVKLPFKDIKEAIPDNFILAKNRLRYLKKRLDKNPDVLNTFDEIIKDYLTQGIVEKVTGLSEHKDPGTVHYLPFLMH